MPSAVNILDLGRLLYYVNTCTVSRSGGSVSGYTAPVATHELLPCTNIYELSSIDAEKAGLATVSRPCRIFVKLPVTGVVQEHDQVTVNSKTYDVIMTKLWPHHDPTHYELLMDFLR